MFRRESNGNVKAGIAIDRGNLSNTVTNVTGQGNATDLIDNNVHCDDDIWTNNQFGRANRHCIQ